MASIVQALGMNVVVWAPTKIREDLAQAGCTKAETLDELLAVSDVVSLHCPLIPQTEKLIGTHELEVMKPSAFLVNTARGPRHRRGGAARRVGRKHLQQRHTRHPRCRSRCPCR